MTGPAVVIIGAGVVGAALADELVGRGWTRVTVIDQGPLPVPGGSSSHAPGLVFQTNPSRTMARFATYTVDKLRSLGCFNQVGGLEVATTPERLTELHRRRGWAASWGIEARVVDPGTCARLHPLIRADRVSGGLHTPTDGLAAARAAVAVQLGRAAAGGADLLGDQRVTAVLTTGGAGRERVTGVRTDRGDVPADLVVSASGFWGPRTGAMVDLPTPLLPMAHQYVWTTPVPALVPRDVSGGAARDDEASSPILRHQDRDLYVREHGSAVGIGSYAHRPIPVDLDDVTEPGGDTMPSVQPFTPGDFAPSWADAVGLLPSLAAAAIDRGVNGIFSFTADGMPVLGEHPELDGYWVAEAVWVTHSAGVGRAMADWLIDGDPGVDVHGCHLGRFDPLQLTPDYVRARASTSFVEVYDILHPLDQATEHRDLRFGPFHQRQRALGAVFGERATWERPLWFEANADLPEVASVPARSPWAARNWSPIATAEAQVTRDRVALFDLTPLVRLDIAGPGALDLLHRFTATDLDRAEGAVAYAVTLSPSGGVVSDLTVVRLGGDRFRVMVNGPLDVARLRRLRRRLLAAGELAPVAVDDITDRTCGLGLWGPAAREVLAPLIDDDLSGDGFPYLTGRPLALTPTGTPVASVDVLALRLSYAGELGWELYVDRADGPALWDALWEAGRSHGLIAAGSLALDALRIEKGYRATGVDLTADHQPTGSGVGFTVRPQLRPIPGPADDRDDDGKLVPLVFEDPTHVVLGSEPVVHRGRTVGYVTSAAYGPSVRASIAYAWLPVDLARPGTGLEVAFLDRCLPATVASEPLFDPEAKRIRS